jgi:hypothetical protein
MKVSIRVGGPASGAASAPPSTREAARSRAKMQSIPPPRAAIVTEQQRLGRYFFFESLANMAAFAAWAFSRVSNWFADAKQSLLKVVR